VKFQGSGLRPELWTSISPFSQAVPETHPAGPRRCCISLVLIIFSRMDIGIDLQVDQSEAGSSNAEARASEASPPAGAPGHNGGVREVEVSDRVSSSASDADLPASNGGHRARNGDQEGGSGGEERGSGGEKLETPDGEGSGEGEDGSLEGLLKLRGGRRKAGGGWESEGWGSGSAGPAAGSEEGEGGVDTAAEATAELSLEESAQGELFPSLAKLRGCCNVIKLFVDTSEYLLNATSIVFTSGQF